MTVKSDHSNRPAAAKPRRSTRVWSSVARPGGRQGRGVLISPQQVQIAWAAAGLGSREPVLVACSGGVDSMVLLHVVLRFCRETGKPCIVGHFDHGLRTPASAADARWVGRLCRTLEVPCLQGRGDVRGYARRHHLSVEMAARRLRHEFLARASLAHGARAVALGHHADDQVELFFLRLFRGAGPQGLSGMAMVSPSPAEPRITLLRPLLGAERGEILRYAKRHGLRWREDATNAQTDILRNRIRRQLLPRLRAEYQPAIDRLVLRAMDVLSAQSEWAQQAARSWLNRRRRARFTGLPVALQREVVRTQLARQGATADFDLVEALRLHPDQPVSAGRQRRFVRGENGLVCVLTPPPAPGFQRRELRVHLGAAQGQVAFAGRRLAWARALWRWPSKRFRRPARSGEEWFDAARVGGVIVLRHWRPGDRFQPSGLARPAKLQDLFTNARVARDERHLRCLATTAAGEVFWVEGLRIGERFKLTPATSARLVWRWGPEETAGRGGERSGPG